MSMLARLTAPLAGAVLVTIGLAGPVLGAGAPVNVPALAAPAQAATPPPPVPPPAPPAEGAPADEGRTPVPPVPPAPPAPPVAPRAPVRAARAQPAVPGDAPRAERARSYVSKGVNIRVDATVTESRAEQVLGRKVVSITLVDGENGSVRSSALVPIAGDSGGYQRVPLNMDAMVFLRDDSRVHAKVTLEYNRGTVDIGEGGAQRAARENFIRQTVSVILENGKPLVVAQSADPEGDRRVTLELRATTLK